MNSAGAIAQRKMDSYRKRGKEHLDQRAELALKAQSFRGQLLAAAIDICHSYDGFVLNDGPNLILGWPFTLPDDPDAPDDLLIGLLVHGANTGPIRIETICSSETEYVVQEEDRARVAKEFQPQIRRLMRFFSVIGRGC